MVETINNYLGMQQDTHFDFQKPFEGKDNFQTFIQENQQKTQNDISRKDRGHAPLILLIFVLLASLVGLSYFTLTQMQEKALLSATNSTTTGVVAGASDNTINNIISGEGFSIVLKEQEPKGFVLDKQPVQFPFILDKKATLTQYLIELKDNSTSNIIKSGIEVYTAEYDNKMDIQTFTKKVLEKIGPNYVLSDSAVNTARQAQLKKLVPKISEGFDYFVGVTTENYYVIKLHTQAKELNELSEISDFTESFIPNIYLN